jgi:hypothetical protein
LSTHFSPHRNIKFYLLFLPFLKAGKSRKEPSLPTITRALLALRVKLRVLVNPRLPLKEKLNLKPPSLRILSPLLLLRRTSGKGVRSQTPAPPKLISPLSRKLHPKRRKNPSTLTMMPSSARKFLSPFSFAPDIFSCFVSYTFSWCTVATRRKILLLT